MCVDDNAITDYDVASKYRVWCAQCQDNTRYLPLEDGNPDMAPDKVHAFPSTTDKTKQPRTVKQFLKAQGLTAGGSHAATHTVVRSPRLAI